MAVLTGGGALLWGFSLLAGATVVGLVRADLRLWERLALSVVVASTAVPVATLAVALVPRVGFGPGATFAGPVALTAAALALARLRSPGLRPVATWRASWEDVPAGARRAHPHALAVLGVSLVAGGIFAWLFAHTLYERDGAIVAGFPTVWADWSLHSTLASSFAVAGNVPPQDPIFSGEALRYPFLPDLHAAMQQVAGDGVGASLAIPGALLCTAITVLVISLSLRLAGSVAVGAVAMLLCVGGGSLGFTGVWWDACHVAGHADADCAPLTALVHPGTLADVARGVPTVVAHQPRAYDNLQNDGTVAVGNVQWYTPLLAWWLPQRTFVYGFAIGTAVLLLVVAGRRAPPGTRSPFILAGLLAGLLPAVHVHSLFALLIVLPLLAVWWRRREWLWMAGTAALLAVPRLVQVAIGGHGVPDTCANGTVGVGGTGTSFPFLEPGWLSTQTHPFDPELCANPGRFGATPLGVLRAVPMVLETALSPSFWGFWLFNNGLVVVVAMTVAAVAALRTWPGALGQPWVARLSERVRSAVPDDLLRLCLPLVAVFAVSNVVVFQTWDWDNTKLLAYWYLGGALLTAAVLVRLLRSGPGRAALAVLGLASLLAAGGLNLVRYARDPNIPYTWAGPEDRALAAQVALRTPRDAVFLTEGNPVDPVLTLAGRAAVSGYAGWLYSYGVDLGARPRDTTTMLAGCDQTAGVCEVRRLFRQYHIDFVEVCTDAANPQCAGASWYARTYPVVAASPAVTVYDVRRP